jgi:uncharacterized membrane protein
MLWDEMRTGDADMTITVVPESTPVKRMYDGANLVLLLLISYALYTAYSKLPERFPTHFNLAGQPNGWGGRTSVIILVALAWVITLTFYILIRYLGRNPRYLNIPHKEEFLKLPEQKQMKYWALISEFMAGTLAGLNLLMYLVLRGIMLVAMGEKTFLPFMYLWLPMGILMILLIFYIIRLITLPGKLIRE